MRLFSFDSTGGRPLNSWLDDKGQKHRIDPKTSKVVISPILDSGGGSRISCFHVGKGGFVPRHSAAAGQLFAVVEGSGWVAGSDERKVAIRKGQAALWAAGESHEAGTDEGMTVIVVEMADAEASLAMRELRR